MHFPTDRSIHIGDLRLALMTSLWAWSKSGSLVATDDNLGALDDLKWLDVEPDETIAEAALEGPVLFSSLSFALSGIVVIAHKTNDFAFKSDRKTKLFRLGAEQDLYLGCTFGVIEKNGTWYSCNNERLGQGREASRKFLKEKEDICELITEKVKAKIEEKTA